MTRHKVTRGFLWVLNHTLNRVTMRLAKWGRGPFSLIQHVGRNTGTYLRDAGDLGESAGRIHRRADLRRHRELVPQRSRSGRLCCPLPRQGSIALPRSSRATPRRVELPIPPPPASSSNSRGERVPTLARPGVATSPSRREVTDLVQSPGSDSQDELVPFIETGGRGCRDVRVRGGRGIRSHPSHRAICVCAGAARRPGGD